MKECLRLFGAVLTCLLIACGDQTPTPTPESLTAKLLLPEQPPAARLPEGVAPTHYRIHLDVDPREPRFSGSVEIDVTLSGSTSFLWLHGSKLDVTSAIAELGDGKSIALEWQQASDHGVAKITAPELLPAGNLRLLFEYSADFNTTLDSLHTVQEGGISYAYTQFEATAARLAFPSFDEPAFKVPFDISLTIPAGYTGISNTPVVSQIATHNDKKTLTFATTKPLPTYLVAFAVGPFDVVEWSAIPSSKLRAKPLPLRGITVQGKGDQIRYALENTAALVLEMEEYFDTPYPYAKLDILAVPDFSSGAMENAGAITYREQLILLDEKSSVNQKRHFFGTHAHELAHQWFGNLVTPDWWDDIWLNESFATWNSAIILDRLFPDEKYRDAQQNGVSRVMTNDSLASARQIREPITRHEDIGSAFNGITYQKGGGVLAMFESFLGRDNFRDGIRHYMKIHAFGNTTAEDFIAAIADANPQINGADLREAFRSFIEQPGLPLVNVVLNCSDEGVSVELSQQRYLPAGSTGNADQTWTIPACLSLLAEGQESSQCFLLKESTETVQLNSEHCPDALLPNTGGTSYYRWSLPPAQWQSLLSKMNDMSITEQISVASSLSAAINTGKISVEEYLASVPPLTRSESWRVAIAPRADVYKIKDFVANEEEKLLLEEKLREWYQPRLEELNALEKRRPDQDQFRMFMMSTLALEAGDTAVRAQLAQMGSAYVGLGGDEKLHPEAIDPNLIYIALLVATGEYGEDFTNLLWKLFSASDNAHDRQNFLSAMAQSTEPKIAAWVRGKLLSSDIKDNEVAIILRGQTDHAKNRTAMWTWAKGNMPALLDRFAKQRQGQLPRFFGTFCTLEEADDLESFFNPIIGTMESGPRNLANALETIRLCAAFVDLHSAG